MIRRGLFAFFENHHDDPGRALEEQCRLALAAEAAGLSELWVSEHHFNDFSVSGPILPLMGYLLGITRTLHIGSAAVLMPYHHPVMVAEAVAALERLSNGRLLFGMAKGAFPMDDKHFRSDPERNRDALFESARIVTALLRGERVTFRGDYYDLDDAALVPLPAAAVPSYLATFGSESSVRFAAEQGLELMMGQTATLEQVDAARTLYRSCSGRDPEMLLLRLCCIDETPGRAAAQAQASAAHFSGQMKRVRSGAKALDAGRFAPVRALLFETHPMAECSLSGTPEECRAQLRAYGDAGVTAVAIRPGGRDFESNRTIVEAFAAL